MNAPTATVYLIPSLLHEEATYTIPFYITEAVKNCQVFFVENERSARRFLKKIWRTFLPGADILIDDYEWFTISDDEEQNGIFREKIIQGKTIGIISEAGCPGVADPGQRLIAIAHDMHARVKPLVGPNSVLLALMASGMNGQRFQFVGYLPIAETERVKAIRELETESLKKNCTQIFIETPYRNNQLVDSILKNCRPSTKLCIAVDLSSETEQIQTMNIAQWLKNKPNIHKHPAIFLVYAGS